MTSAMRLEQGGMSEPTELIGQAPAFRRALELAHRFAPTMLPVLLVGATGTGKELFARQVHAWSGRSGPLVDVDCGALPREMVESLLFGHRRGAYTGAVEASDGLIAAADGGTLFLDEVSSLSMEAQAKLLRVLETGQVRRLGDTLKRTVCFRVIAAAQEDLEQRLRDGRFRFDLYQRLSGGVIGLPSLMARGADVWALAQGFAREGGRDLLPETRALLQRHHWPGNVRELRMAVTRAVTLAGSRRIGVREVREAIALGAVAGLGLGDTADQRGRSELEELLAACNGDVGRAAVMLGIGRSTLYRRLQSVGIRR